MGNTILYLKGISLNVKTDRFIGVLINLECQQSSGNVNKPHNFFGNFSWKRCTIARISSLIMDILENAFQDNHGHISIITHQRSIYSILRLLRRIYRCFTKSGMPPILRECQQSSQFFGHFSWKWCTIAGISSLIMDILEKCVLGQPWPYIDNNTPTFYIPYFKVLSQCLRLRIWIQST